MPRAPVELGGTRKPGTVAIIIALRILLETAFQRDRPICDAEVTRQRAQEISRLNVRTALTKGVDLVDGFKSVGFGRRAVAGVHARTKSRKTSGPFWDLRVRSVRRLR